MSCGCPATELPGESAAGELPPSGASGLQARRGAAHFPGASSHRHQGACSAPAVVFAPEALQTTASATLFVSGIGDMRGREVPARRPSVQREGNLSLSAIVQCERPAASRSSAAGSLPLRKPGSRQSRLPRLLRSRSSVRLRRGYTWALFRPVSPSGHPEYWAVPAQATEAVCPPTSSVSSVAPGNLRSPFRGAPEPAAPYFQTASEANAPLRSAPLVI